MGDRDKNLTKLQSAIVYTLSTSFVWLRSVYQRRVCMNKAKLVEQMAKLTKLPKSTCKDCLEAFVTAVSNFLKQNKQVVLTGFGTFSVMQRKSRVGINPATNKKMVIPSKKVPKFKPGKALKALVK